VYDGPGALAPSRHGISEPIGDRLGIEAISSAQVIVVPALAVDRRGRRLGQGGVVTTERLAGRARTH